jgi:hypothetical protein
LPIFLPAFLRKFFCSGASEVKSKVILIIQYYIIFLYYIFIYVLLYIFIIYTIYYYFQNIPKNIKIRFSKTNSTTFRPSVC